MRNGVRRVAGAMALVAAYLQFGPALAQSKPSAIKIAIVQFLSGAGAPHDASAVNTARLLTEQFNAAGGIEGVRLNTMYVDEAGSATDKVAEYRRLVQDEKITVAIGYTSSANCLAVAPVADELKTLTIFHVCANYRLIDKGVHRYVFRTAAHAASENISAALYVLATKPDLKTIAGLNYDYAYGRDSWDVFKRTILKLKPDVQVAGELWTKFLATEYSAEISRLLALKPDVIHTVNWGAGLTSLINQGETRGLFEQSLVMMTTGLLNQAEILPKGAAFSGRGYHLQYPDPDKNAGNREYLRSYKAKFNSMPDYQGTFMAQAFYGLKAAIEKAAKVKNGAWPTTEEIAAAMEGLEFDTPRGRVLVRKDHEAVHEAMWGLTSGQKHPAFGYPILDQFRVFPAADVTPPEGKKTVEWIESWPTRK
ncbi:MAG TPA: ABC transporter substrate-binding protein [Bradyrhizobium sp.]|nr:ABC transporter substrate-binding protein [Bradyrhizobium sp.]